MSTRIVKLGSISKGGGGSDNKFTLSDYTFEELLEVAEDLEDNEEDSQYYEKFKTFACAGMFYKSDMMWKPRYSYYNAGYTYAKTVYFYIPFRMQLIGCLQDTRSDGKKAGLTFIVPNPHIWGGGTTSSITTAESQEGYYRTPIQRISPGTNLAYDFSDTSGDVYTSLNSDANSSSTFSHLPDLIANNAVQVNKLVEGGLHSSPTITSVTAKFWPLSRSEFLGSHYDGFIITNQKSGSEGQEIVHGAYDIPDTGSVYDYFRTKRNSLLSTYVMPNNGQSGDYGYGIIRDGGQFSDSFAYGSTSGSEGPGTPPAASSGNDFFQGMMRTGNVIFDSKTNYILLGYFYHSGNARLKGSYRIGSGLSALLSKANFSTYRAAPTVCFCL